MSLYEECRICLLIWGMLQMLSDTRNVANAAWYEECCKCHLIWGMSYMFLDMNNVVSVSWYEECRIFSDTIESNLPLGEEEKYTDFLFLRNRLPISKEIRFTITYNKLKKQDTRANKSLESTLAKIFIMSWSLFVITIIYSIMRSWFHVFCNFLNK